MEEVFHGTSDGCRGRCEPREAALEHWPIGAVESIVRVASSTESV
jgi:hypothetical protein